MITLIDRLTKAKICSRHVTTLAQVKRGRLSVEAAHFYTWSLLGVSTSIGPPQSIVLRLTSDEKSWDLLGSVCIVLSFLGKPWGVLGGPSDPTISQDNLFLPYKLVGRTIDPLTPSGGGGAPAGWGPSNNRND